MAGHRYWRIYITANNGDNESGNVYVGISTLAYHTSIGGSNVATGGTASASDYYSTNPPSNAFDGNNSSQWTSSGATGAHWLAYDFGTAVDLVEASLLPDQFNFPLRAPKDFRFDYSDDGSTWTTANSFTGVGGWVSGVAQVFAIKLFNVAVVTTIDGVGASRRVRFYNVSDGSFIKEITTDGTGAGTASFYVAGAVMAVADDNYGDKWIASKTYAAGAMALPLTPNGHWYKTTGGGTSGASEPTWPTGGGTATDGTVTWTDMGTMRAPEVQGPYIPS